jgi:hypothetical protein
MGRLRLLLAGSMLLLGRDGSGGDATRLTNVQHIDV